VDHRRRLGDLLGGLYPRSQLIELAFRNDVGHDRISWRCHERLGGKRNQSPPEDKGVSDGRYGVTGSHPKWSSPRWSSKTVTCPVRLRRQGPPAGIRPTTAAPSPA